MIDQLKEKHDQEMLELQQEFSNYRNNQEALIEQLNERNSDLDLKYKLLKADYDKDTENLKS